MPDLWALLGDSGASLRCIMKTAASRLPTDGDDAAGLHAAVRRAAMQRKEPCILDLCVKNARDFEQGRPDLVARDLDESIVGDPAVWQRVDSLMHEHGVYDAFELRGELINYKKALYHLYQEAMALEKDLRQLSALLHCSLSAAPASKKTAWASSSSGRSRTGTSGKCARVI